MAGRGYLSQLESDYDLRRLQQQSHRPVGPPVPPRNPVSASSSLPLPPVQPPSATSALHSPYSSAVTSASLNSDESLRPQQIAGDGRRQLLLVYIHGFMGNETSFREFPAHVHNVLTVTLADAYSVHSKIYPRYKSKGAMESAAEDFSKWLSPHESPNVDVILLGHSMGGLLAADVALLRAPTATSLRHRIVGTINFDVPFLGMHPGVISSGLGSIFRPADNSQDINEAIFDVNAALTAPADASSEGNPASSTTPVRQDTLFAHPGDPNFNPSFVNDIKLADRKGVDNVFHFIKKHYGGLADAATNVVKSHAKFGGTMTKYKSLAKRYAQTRALEEPDPAARNKEFHLAPPPARVRFVNYYTACSGRPTKPKSHSPSESARTGEEVGGDETETDLMNLSLHAERTPSLSQLHLPNSSEKHNEARPSVRDGQATNNPAEAMEQPSQADSAPKSPKSTTSSVSDSDLPPHWRASLPNLPLVPPEPMKPRAWDPMLYPSQSAQRIAQRDYDRQLRAYQQAVNDRNEAIKDRSDLEKELRKQAARDFAQSRDKQAAQTSKATVAASAARETERQSSLSGFKPPESTAEPADEPSEIATEDRQHLTSSSTRSLHRDGTSTPSSTPSEHKKNKKKKDRKFCMLPRKDAAGNRDATWVRIFMPGVDEVGAHCGIFVSEGESYEMLVGDTAWRVENWVRGL